MNVKDLTISDVSEGLRNKDFSCLEVTKAHLDWIEQRNPQINAYRQVTAENALLQAKDVDKKISSGDVLSPLAGVPCAIKDNILIKGVKATGGSHILSEYTAMYNATVIDRLLDNDAVFLGKTNMDEFAMGSSGESSAYGLVKNPLDLEKVPGGSSAGSAAAVADDQCVFALGTDTGGSIRQPASFCGVVGLKPTYGRVSRYGAMAMASGFDQIGPMTKTVKDAALLLNVLSGKDEFDATCVDQKEKFDQSLAAGVKGLKIGVPKEYFIKGMDTDVESAVLQAINRFKELGAEIVELSLAHTKYALSTYYILMTAEASSNLARYDGVRYGHREPAGNLQEMYLKTRHAGFGDEVKRRIMLGTFVLSAGYYDAYYNKAQKVRTLMKRDFDSAFADVDCLVTPTSPTVAFNVGEKIDDPLTMYLADIFTVSANIAGVPAISLPCGVKDGLPIGLQIIGSHFSESKLLQVAAAFEQNQ